MRDNIHILVTTADRVVDLRHRILRAGLPRETAIFPGDDRADSLHVAAVQGQQVVGCATFHLNEWNDQIAYQLRGMATAEPFRRNGLGRRILQLAELQLLHRGVTRQLWCNARLPAVPFYQSMGWKMESEVFEIPTAGPHVKMSKRIGG